MKEQFYDLSIDILNDGTVRLAQRDYCGESVIIDAHPQQIIHIANDLTANATERTQTQANGLTERTAILERRLMWVRDRFAECHAVLPVDFYERCGEAFEFGAWLTAGIDVSSEFCADFPSAPSYALGNAPSKPLSNPLEAPFLTFGDGCLPSAAGCDSEHPDSCHADLLTDRAGGKQHGND